MRDARFSPCLNLARCCRRPLPHQVLNQITSEKIVSVRENLGTGTVNAIGSVQSRILQVLALIWRKIERRRV